MQRIAFKMQLLKGCTAEYKKRHDEIWPELVTLLKSAGIHDYSIFLEEETNSLFAILKINDPSALSGLAAKDLMKKWWTSLKDIMSVNPDHSPVQIPLKEIFYLG